MRVFWQIEMWCRRQAAAAILPLLLAGWLTGESSEALTTFGKSNTQTPKPVAPTTLPARPCTRQGDCLGIRGTSCVRTPYEAKTRCLCGDNQPPVNGQCDHNAQGSKALYHACATDNECNDETICGTPNITGTPPPHLRVISPTDKICLCNTDGGYREQDYTCNDADILKTSVFAVIFVACIRKMLANSL